MKTAPRHLPGRIAPALRALLAAAALLVSGPGLAQAINDVPMAVKNNVAANFMFMLDSSGSMLHIVPAAPYSASATYVESCPSATTGANNIVVPAADSLITIAMSSGVPYARVSGSTTNRRHTTVTGSGNRICFNNTASYPARLVTTGNVGTTTGRYTGHFLNWYFGDFAGPTNTWPSSGIKPITSPSTTTAKSRWDLAKTAAISTIGDLPVPTTTGANALVRVGLSTYAAGGNDGGALKYAMTDLTTATRTTLTGTTIPGLSAPSGYTPLASTLSDIGRYLATGYNGDITLPSAATVNIDTFLKKDGTDTSSTNSCLAGSPVACNSTSATAAQKPIQQWCQRSYAVMVTDGRPTYDRSFNNNTWLRDYDGDCQGPLAANCVGSGSSGNWDRKIARQPYESVGGTEVGSDYLDDVAKALFDIDLRPDLQPPLLPDGSVRRKSDGTPFVKRVDSPNNVLTYAIGFADEAVKNDPLLISTAGQGGGLFLTAEDGPALTKAFKRVVTDAFAKDAAAAAVAVANAQISLNNIGYASSYKSGSWYGDLVAYSLDTTTALQTGSDIWSFRDRLDAQTSRKIATWNGSTGVAFAAGLSYTGKPATLTDEVINYLRGDRTGEGTTYRQRQYVLGDIINAEPVVVNYAGDVPIIFQGANDGMLHVVDGRTNAAVTTRGQELWAYVPRLLHGSLDDLSDLTYEHRYFIDGTPATAEVTGLSFTRLLVGGLGKGGRGYYALNISSYAAATEADVASKALWEFSPSGMGYSFGTPLIVKTAAGWRVVVSSGYDASVSGRVWVLDPADGAILATLDTGVTGAGLAHLSRQANTAADALVRYVWGGDLLGNVYRFDLDSSTVVKIATLTDSGGTSAQPITSPPEVGPVAGSSTKFTVHIGTGRYLADEDVPGSGGSNTWSTQRQSIYGLIDDTALTGASALLADARGTNGATCPAGGGDGSLVCQSLTYVSSTNTYQATAHPVDTASKRGWYVDLPTDTNMGNGRVVSKPSLTTGGTLALTVNIPTNVLCDPGGKSWFLALNTLTGGAVPRNVGGNTYYDAVGFFLGYALASRPVIVTTAQGKRALIRMSDKTVQAPPVPEAASTAAQWRRIYWRQVN
ncbi:MAG: PilC/PilY family type IV pilus protein [Rubrivivax sp.]|nr:PilC/PilY family type IV pilus protein [Rubrivivax sp.]